MYNARTLPGEAGLGPGRRAEGVSLVPQEER